MSSCNHCTLKHLQRRYGDRLIKYKGSYYEKNAEPSKGQEEEKLLDGTSIRFVAWFFEVPNHCRC